MSLILASLFGCLIGFMLGYFGSGGSILTVPILVYFLHIDPKSAIPMSLLIVGLTAFLSSFQQWRQKTICPKAALIFGISGSIASLLGTKIANSLTGSTQLFIFSLVMLISAFAMVAKWRWGHLLIQVRPFCNIYYPFTILGGILVGILTGAVGIGSGFLIVPVLIFSGLEMQLAIGTSLLVISINCFAGVIGYWGKVDFHPFTTGVFVLFSGLASMGGAWAGNRYKMKNRELKFALFILVMSVLSLLKNIGLI